MLLAAARSRIVRARKDFAASPRRFLIPLAIANLVVLLPLFLRAHQAEDSNSPFSFPNKVAADPDEPDASSSIPDIHPTMSPPPPVGTNISLAGVSFAEIQAQVRLSTKNLFNAYFDACAGRDEFSPTSGTCHDWYGVGLTILDSLDTLLLMNLTEEYKRSREWAQKSLSFKNMKQPSSMFEIVIRGLGGLLSAYEITNDSLWLDKAVELGDQLLPSFSTHTGCPYMNTYFGPGASERIGSLDSSTSPADAGTLQLEMRTLARMSGRKDFADAVDKCINSMLDALPESYLVSAYFDVTTGQFGSGRLSIGGSIDSFYEMMIKTWVGFGRQKKDARLVHTFTNVTEAVFSQLAGVSPMGLHFVGERSSSTSELRQLMDHLTCFFPGTLVIAALHGLGGGLEGKRSTDYITRARNLTRTCFMMSRGQHEVAGEITDLSGDSITPMPGHDHNFLRPEIVEALFYMNRLDPSAKKRNKYKSWGRDMWQGMLRVAQVPEKPFGVLSSTMGLLGQSPIQTGKLHSFVIAETLKYLYLLFDERTGEDAPFPLHEWVYNTEAHPVRVVQAPTT